MYVLTGVMSYPCSTNESILYANNVVWQKAKLTLIIPS